MTREKAIKIVKEFISGTCLHLVDQEALETLIPELAESEDERIRKTLIEELSVCNIVGELQYRLPKATRDECLAWLERQKEQKSIKWTDLTWKDIVELEGIINNVHYDFSAGIGQESFGKEVLERFRSTKGDEYLDEAEQKYWREEGQKEQKPVERSLEDDHIIGFVYDLLNEIEWKDNWAMSKDECLRLLNSYSPQQPAEWSEEEKKIIGNIRHLIFEHAFENGGVDVNGDYCKDVYQEADDFLKSLRPQPKAEWSEEDEKMIDHLIEALPMWATGQIAMLPSQADEYVKRLKSIRPKQKHGWRHYIWAVNLRFDYDGLVRYEDNGSYEIVTAGNKPKRKVNGEYILLKDIQSVDWKPSEEQMKQLKIAADLWEFGPMVTTRKQFPDLESLYEHFLRN